MSPVEAVMNGARVVPVVSLADPADAEPLATALARSGIRAIEVTLRTPAALDAVRVLKAADLGLAIGVGTVRTPAQAEAALEAGAAFLVSPGATRELAAALRALGAPSLPGAATASETMALCELGFDRVKLFPAVPAGGIGLLKALAGPFPEVRFCPTGGIGAAEAPDYLALANVFAVGGSWLAPDPLLARRDWSAIEGLARAAALL